MLQKIRGVRQDDAGRTRHWFQDDFFDLFVWTDAAGALLAFQLGYGRARGEQVLTWDAGGLRHRHIDDGEATPLKNMSPLLTGDKPLRAAEVAAEFASRAAPLDERWRAFILERIAEAAARARPAEPGLAAQPDA